MKFKALLTVLTIALMSMAAFVASGGLHWTGGTGFGSGSVLISGKIAGLSQGTVAQADITITGDNLIGFCRNKGGKIAPGQQPVNLLITAASDPVVADGNGNVNISVSIDLVEASGLTADDIDCPNGNWSVDHLEGDITVTLTASVVNEDGSLTPADVDTYSCQIRERDAYINCNVVR